MISYLEKPIDIVPGETYYIVLGESYRYRTWRNLSISHLEKPIISYLEKSYRYRTWRNLCYRTWRNL